MLDFMQRTRPPKQPLHIIMLALSFDKREENKSEGLSLAIE